MNLLAKINEKIKNIKRTHGDYELDESHTAQAPFDLFLVWFDEILKTDSFDPSAMVLATVDTNGYPDTRVVLLKELNRNQFIFYTNYKSQKGLQLAEHPVAALNFYWPTMVRQVRLKGRVTKVDRKKSEAYFATRPREAQLSSYASQQSAVILERDVLMKEIQKLAETFSEQTIICPEHWGGYVFEPFEYEFFQGRRWRMHDRFRYTLENEGWKCARLAP
jgi:pyridoxamine 5'-phosphate oxidase